MATIFDWASDTGSTIVGAVVPNAAEFQSTVQQGNVTYGLIRYTFNAVDISAAQIGHTLNAAGFVNATNNANGLVIYAVNNASNYVDVLSTVRTNNGDDETGITGTGSITSGAAPVQKPSNNYITQGFKVPQKPSDAYWNWAISQLASSAQTATIRAAHVNAAASQLTPGGSFTDLDGAGIPFGFDGVASNQTWTASANDAAFETMTGLNVDPVLKGGNEVLHIATYEMNDGISAPVEAQLDVDSTTQYQFVTNTSGLLTGGSNQVQWSFSFPAMHSGSAGASDYNTEAKRRTGLGTVNGRSWAIELPTQDQSSNTLVRFSSTGITQATFSNGSYADMTGYTTGSQSFNNGNKALIIGLIPIDTSSAANQTRPSFKLFRDATELFVYNNNGGATFSSGTDNHETGMMLPFAWVDDVTGSHTYKLQGLYSTTGSGASTDYAGDNEGAFMVIELPATWDSDTLVRATDSIGSVNISDGAGFSELATSGSVTTNGHRVLMGLFLEYTTGGTTTTTTFQFEIDGSAEGPEFDCKQTQDLRKPLLLLWMADAPSAGAHTFSVDWKSVGDTSGSTVGQFFALEMPTTADDSGSAPEVTFYNSTGKKVKVSAPLVVNSSVSELVQIRAMEQVGSGGSYTAAGEVFEITPQAGQDTAIDFTTVIPASASGQDEMHYKLQANSPTGVISVKSAPMIAQEVPADGS